MKTIPKAEYEVIGMRSETTGDILDNVVKKIRKAGKKGSKNRRVIKTFTQDGFEHSYHATRGWRKNKV